MIIMSRSKSHDYCRNSVECVKLLKLQQADYWAPTIVFAKLYFLCLTAIVWVSRNSRIYGHGGTSTTLDCNGNRIVVVFFAQSYHTRLMFPIAFVVVQMIIMMMGSFMWHLFTFLDKWCHLLTSQLLFNILKQIIAWLNLIYEIFN